LLPRIKEDLAEQIPIRSDARKLVDDVLAITHGRTTHVYVPSVIAKHAKDLSRWRALARIFDIGSFTIHATERSQNQRSTKSPLWVLFGAGGVARWVIKKAPFHGELRSITNMSVEDGAIAYSQIDSSVEPHSDGFEQLMIAIVMSDIDKAVIINRAVTQLSPTRSLNHALNLRPLGFGTPQTHKPSPLRMREILDNFSYIWILANHRLRHTGNYKNQLSASHILSRFTKAAALALIACFEDEEHRNLLVRTASSHNFGLIGAVRYSSEANRFQLLRRLLYTMLCEDAYLHSASRILVLWPYSIPNEQLKISLGQHEYSVEVVTRRENKRHYDIVGLAFDVQLSERTDDDFIDFCISLLEGYGWILRSRAEISIVMENEGKALRVRPLQSIKKIAQLIEAPSASRIDDELIITNKTIPDTMRRKANHLGRHVIHYSELGLEMEKRFQFNISDNLFESE
jgi:hypothetical protein